MAEQNEGNVYTLLAYCRPFTDPQFLGQWRQGPEDLQELELYQLDPDEQRINSGCCTRGIGLPIERYLVGGMDEGNLHSLPRHRGPLMSPEFLDQLGRDPEILQVLYNLQQMDLSERRNHIGYPVRRVSSLIDEGGVYELHGSFAQFLDQLGRLNLNDDLHSHIPTEPLRNWPHTGFRDPETQIAPKNGSFKRIEDPSPPDSIVNHRGHRRSHHKSRAHSKSSGKAERDTNLTLTSIKFETGKPGNEKEGRKDEINSSSRVLPAATPPQVIRALPLRKTPKVTSQSNYPHVPPEALTQHAGTQLVGSIPTSVGITGLPTYQPLPTDPNNDKQQLGQGIEEDQSLSGPALVSPNPRKRVLPCIRNRESYDHPGGSENEIDKRNKHCATHRHRRKYACPYYRSDPENPVYAIGGKFEDCRAKGIKTDKLKEHIRRKHTKPAQCTGCGRRGDPGEIRAHRKNVQCASKDDIEKVDDKTLEIDKLLEKRRGATWHEVFGILFPGPTVPLHDSQYFNNKSEDYRQRLSEALMTYLERTLPSIHQGFRNSLEYKKVEQPENNSISLSSLMPGVERLAEMILSRYFDSNLGDSGTSTDINKIDYSICNTEIAPFSANSPAPLEPISGAGSLWYSRSHNMATEPSVPPDEEPLTGELQKSTDHQGGIDGIHVDPVDMDVFLENFFDSPLNG